MYNENQAINNLQKEPEKFFNIPTAAEYLNCSTAHVSKLVKYNYLTNQRLGQKHVIFKQKDLDEFLLKKNNGYFKNLKRKSGFKKNHKIIMPKINENTFKECKNTDDVIDKIVNWYDKDEFLQDCLLAFEEYKENEFKRRAERYRNYIKETLEKVDSVIYEATETKLEDF